MSPKQPTTETPATDKPAEALAEAKPVTATPASGTTGKKNNKTVLIVVGVVVFVFVIIPALVFGAGAIFVGKKLADNGVQVDSSGESVTVKDDSGNEFSAGGTQQLPEDFPSNVPVYSKDGIVASGRTTVDGKTAWTVSIQTNDSPATIASNLQTEFSKDGWTISTESVTNDGGYMSASNGTNDVNIFYGSESGKTVLVYTVSATSAE